MINKLRTIKCPICGHLNRNLDHEDSRGWMECERCESISVIPTRDPAWFEMWLEKTIKQMRSDKVLMQ